MKVIIISYGIFLILNIFISFSEKIYFINITPNKFKNKINPIYYFDSIDWLVTVYNLKKVNIINAKPSYSLIPLSFILYTHRYKEGDSYAVRMYKNISNLPKDFNPEEYFLSRQEDYLKHKEWVKNKEDQENSTINCINKVFNENFKSINSTST